MYPCRSFLTHALQKPSVHPQAAVAHIEDHEEEAEKIAMMRDAILGEQEHGNMDEKKVADLMDQLTMHLFNHRLHDHEMVQVMQRIAQAPATGTVDCTVSSVDESTAHLLTQIDFLILDDVGERIRLKAMA
jgi:hypothetical protein